MASRKSVSSYESPLLGPGVWGEGGLPWARRLVRTKRGTRPTLSSIYQKSDLITGTRPKGQEFDVQFKEGWLDADLLKYFLLRFMQRGRIVEGNPGPHWAEAGRATCQPERRTESFKRKVSRDYKQWNWRIAGNGLLNKQTKYNWWEHDKHSGVFPGKN